MSSHNDLAFLSAAEQGELIKRRAISPVDLVRNCLDRIERYDAVLRAYITVCAEQALAAARRAESEISAGNYRGPLHGVPVAVDFDQGGRDPFEKHPIVGDRHGRPSPDAEVVFQPRQGVLVEMVVRLVQ